MSDRGEAGENPLIEVTCATAPAFLSDCPGDRLGEPDGGKWHDAPRRARW